METLDALTKLLKSGKDPRRLMDVTCRLVGPDRSGNAGPKAFNMPHHCYEYHNTLAWFWDNFDHPRRLRLLYVAAMFANRVAYNQQGLGEVHPAPSQVPSAASGLSADAVA